MCPDRVWRAALLLAALVLPGCLEHEVTTTIRPDGTCERRIVIRNAGAALPDGIFPVAADSSWDTSTVRTDTSQSGHVWTLKKDFASYEELSREYEKETPPGKIRVSVAVEKQFRWFYTYVDYRETYARFSPYDLIPPSAVMTEDEILRYTYGDTSAALKAKVDEWEARNLFEMIYAPLVRGAERLQNRALAARLASYKDEAFHAFIMAAENDRRADSLIASAGYRGPATALFQHGLITDAGVDAMTEVAVRVFHADSVRALKDELRAGWHDMEKRGMENIDRQAHGESFTNTVIMPGTVLETSAPDVKGSALSWKLEASQLALHDYEMRAESRMVNVWLMALTGLFVLGLLFVAFAVPATIRRRRPLLTPMA